MSTAAQFDATLKPCPFCGKPAEVDTLRGYSQYPSGKPGTAVVIYCTACHAEMMICREDCEGATTDELLEHLRTSWNTRVAQ